jgi:hypothetical protein
MLIFLPAPTFTRYFDFCQVGLKCECWSTYNITKCLIDKQQMIFIIFTVVLQPLKLILLANNEPQLELHNNAVLWQHIRGISRTNHILCLHSKERKWYTSVASTWYLWQRHQTGPMGYGVMEISTRISKDSFREHIEVLGRSCQSEQWENALWNTNQFPRK